MSVCRPTKVAVGGIARAPPTAEARCAAGATSTAAGARSGGVLCQDRHLQVAKGLTRVDQVVHERTGQPPVHGQRVALPARPVQGEHQLPVELFMERMLKAECLEFGDELAVLAQRQTGPDDAVPRLQQQIVQPPCRGVESGKHADVIERVAAP
jgi:hypothetical protein